MGQIQEAIHKVGELGYQLRKIDREITKPETIHDILEWIVEGFASNHCGPTFVNGLARNRGVEVIAGVLNELQKEDGLIFQYDYEVVYIKKEKVE